MPSRGCIQKLTNCRLLRDHQLIFDDIWVRDGKIQNPEKLFFDEHVVADVVTDCNNLIIAPGFIDVQLNGAFGLDFSSVSDTIDEDLEKVAKGILSHGVTSFCPTIVTVKHERYQKILPHFYRRDGSIRGAGVLGVHLEGPFISKDKRGAHLLECITDMKDGFSSLTDVYGSNLDNVAIVTIAPELPGALEVIAPLRERGIVVSLGHSMATLADGEAAIARGAQFITHLFNAMLPFHHRDPHLMGLLASDDEIPSSETIFYSMIADGVHTHPAALRIAQRTYPKGLVLITDAIPAMGLPSGIHPLGCQMIEVKDNRAVIAGTDLLCGSIATLDQCVRFFKSATRCSQIEALESASLNPAQLLGITDRKGTLDYTTDADFILLDDALNVHATYVAGEQVWKDPVTVLTSKNYGDETFDSIKY